MKITRLLLIIVAIIAFATMTDSDMALACTGITLHSLGGDVVTARTVDWSKAKYDSQYVIVPRGYELQAYATPTQKGMKVNTTYGFVGLTAGAPEVIVDGVNEQHLCAELFFFPGFGKYPDYIPSQASITVGDLQLVSMILGTCANLDDVVAFINSSRISHSVPGAETTHWRFTQADGRQIILEIIDGNAKFYDSIGVLANAPSYDWHLTNLNNYINLKPGVTPPHQLDGIELSSMSNGTGLLGLPGDFSSPSRFVRAAIFQGCARKQPSAYMTVMQSFQILNNLDVPEGTTEAPEDPITDMLSATQWTCSTDVSNLVVYYHTQSDRNIRAIDLKAIDFGKVKYQYHSLDSVTTPITYIKVK